MKVAQKTKFIALTIAYLLFYSISANARYAAIVIDADSGRVVHEVEATQRWYPASLTKVMTIYMTLKAIESGRLRLNDTLTVSAHASRQPNSKLGLRYGQNISVEDAIMAVTTRSANDAAVVLAERLGGTESNFAFMMTEQAHRMGMNSSSFQNASGLPDEGQISSARDLALLSAALIRDFPQHYSFFGATEFAYKGRLLPNTNRILKTYPDADGLKTGFTCGSGYNLIASARRNGRRLIGVLLGAHSSGERFQQMGNLLDLGFARTQAGVFGMPVEQLTDTHFLPPPFQLSTNRCAGSAEHMGADLSTIANDEAARPRLVSHKPGKQRVHSKQTKNKSAKTRSTSVKSVNAKSSKSRTSSSKLSSIKQSGGKSSKAKTASAKPVSVKSNHSNASSRKSKKAVAANTKQTKNKS